MGIISDYAGVGDVRGVFFVSQGQCVENQNGIEVSYSLSISKYVLCIA